MRAAGLSKVSQDGYLCAAFRGLCHTGPLASLWQIFFLPLSYFSLSYLSFTIIPLVLHWSV